MATYNNAISCKVDFCAYIHPGALCAIGIQSIRDQGALASISINQIDFPPLHNRPFHQYQN
ncbi:hypothetical protein LZ30DRAFT_726034 [Colletotrichum cereale]|nr:hypothetical protein LZ30DRAFT_726034 [Colletotrichum cereale]